MTARTRKHELAVGTLLLVALAILGYLAIQVGAFRMEAGTYRVQAVFDHAGGVVPGAVVSVAGVDVGSVDRIWVQDEKAWMELVIDEDLVLASDTAAAIRARSVLGEKYVQLLPGDHSGPPLSGGDTILETEGQLEIDEMVNSMGPLLNAVDADQLGGALAVLSDALAEDPERVERMLDDAEGLLHNLRIASEDAPAMVAEGRAAVADLRQLAQDARPMVEHGQRVLERLERASEPLAQASEGAPELVDEARLAVEDARALVAKLEGSTDELEQVLNNLTEFDMLALRKLAREDGVLVRLKPTEIEED